MYRCLWCGWEFDEPRRVEDGIFLGNIMIHEECPECGNDDFEEIKEDEDEDV